MSEQQTVDELDAVTAAAVAGGEAIGKALSAAETGEETREPEPAAAGPEEPAETPPRGLYAKLAAIMGELSAIPAEKMRHVTVETRSGGSYSYDYITEATLMEELRPRLAREGIAVMYQDTILRSPAPSEEGDNLTIVKVTLTFIDGETGEKWGSSSEGYGTDVADKGANKAKTSAMRYLLWKMFLFASDLDPETESVDRRSGGSRAAANGKPASQAQRTLVGRLLGELDEAGVTFGGSRPYDAIFTRTSVEDQTSPQASRLIDLLQSAKKAEPGDLSTEPLDALLGEPREGGDFPPPDDIPPDAETGYGS